MRTLLVGFKAADLTPELLEGDVTCHVLDVYHRHAIEKVHHAKAVCSPHLPEGPWDRIVFRTGPKLMSGELSLDLLQEIALLLKKEEPEAPPLRKNPKFRLDFVGEERDRNDLLDKVSDAPKRIRSFRAEWPASVPGGEKLMFTSYPGCFCHRRLDEGGLALAEVVSRELKDERLRLDKRGEGVERDEGLKVLDMGCGCGLVGFLIANRLATNQTIPQSNNPTIQQSNNSAIPQSNNPTIQQSNNSPISLVLVDSHSRAVEAANENAAKFGIPAEVILSDNGTPERMDGSFDVFVGNPPYYSDYRIADVFLETAKRALRPGGVCYTVCKNAAGLKPVQERYFPSVEVVNRRGYAVLKSKKSS